MTISIVHPFVNPKADGADSTITRPSDWNAAHTLTGLGTGVETALGINVGSAGAVITNGGALGTPSSGVGTNITGVNAATLGGATFAAPGAIGGGTPSTGAFTMIIASPTGSNYGLTVNTVAGADTAGAVFNAVSGKGSYIDFNVNGTLAAEIYSLSGSLTMQGRSATSFQLGVSAAVQGAIVSSGFEVATSTAYCFSSTTSVIGTIDATLSRSAAGILQIGTTANNASGSLNLTNLAATGTLGVRALSTLTDGPDGTNTSGYKFVSFVSNSAEAGNVIRVGTTSAVVFTTTSDERLKTVLGDADRDAASKRILAHRMRNYEWNDSPGVNVIGPVAQETYLVDSNPGLVQRGGDDVTKNPWTVNMSGFIPDLIMTVQRQQAQIEALTKLLEKSWRS